MSARRKIRHFLQRRGDGGTARDPFADQQRLLGASGAQTILDVGAHTGSVAAQYLRSFPRAAVYAFEPAPDAFAELQARFAGTDRVEPIRSAVGDSIGTADFYVNAYAPASSLLPVAAAGRQYYPPDAEQQDTIEVPVTTLDAFLAERGIERVDILKFDIQGGELMALRGAAGALGAARVGLVYAEVLFVPYYEGQPMFHDVAAYLADFGYRLYNLYHAAVAPSGQLRHADAVFLSEPLRRTALGEPAAKA